MPTGYKGGTFRGRFKVNTMMTFYHNHDHGFKIIIVDRLM